MSAENDSNILTKNFSAELHQKHSTKMMSEKVEDVSRSGNIQVKMKGDQDVVLTSNSQFENISRTRGSQT